MLRFHPGAMHAVARLLCVCSCVVATGCSKASNPAPPASAQPALASPSASSVTMTLRARAFPLPDESGPVTLDMLAYDRSQGQVWVPVGEGGSVDVFTIATSAFTRVTGFKTAEREAHGRKRTMGPSAAAVGDGFVYVGDRAAGEVCVVSDKTLKLGECVPLPSPPDVIGYDPRSKEIWATTPKQSAVVVLDATNAEKPKVKSSVKTDGSPECYAIDSDRAIFYTNLEDKNRTVAIDMTTHAVKATWPLGCGERGPRGIAVDHARNFVFVACSDHLEVLDASHAGALLGKLGIGEGVDAIEYVDATKRLYAAAAKDARLNVVAFSDSGRPSIVATGDTAAGARNAVVDSAGAAYVVDPETARLLVLAPN